MKQTNPSIDKKMIGKYDASDMFALIESFPSQCSEAKDIGMSFKAPDRLKRDYKNIVCTGLGGSAIGADLVRSYVNDEIKVPLLVNRNYTLPGFVGEDTLVVASSYSGNTEETISAYKDARAKGAALIAITSGGEMERLAGEDGNPVISIPEGFPPRCALGYSFFPLLILLSKLGFIKDKAKDIEDVISVMKALRARNAAKIIARGLYLKYPVIYGGQDHIDSVVTRWRGQLAENSKTLSSSHIFPEMNHNEIVGWENPKKFLKDFIVVILRDSGDHPRTALRMNITKDIIKTEGVKVIEVNSSGKTLMARIFSLIYTGDLVSFYLAILNKTDPTPVERVTYLKKELAKR